MISLLSYSKMKSEQKLCKDTVINICSRITDDDLKFVLINNYEDFLNLTSSLPSYDISIFDIVNDRAINAAESARSENKSMFIMIIADKEYITYGIYKTFNYGECSFVKTFFKGNVINCY